MTGAATAASLQPGLLALQPASGAWSRTSSMEVRSKAGGAPRQRSRLLHLVAAAAKASAAAAFNARVLPSPWCRNWRSCRARGYT